MPKTATVIRFDPNGPDGLEEWEQMDYSELVAGEPVQNGHIYHEIEDQGYLAGVWDCTAFTEKMQRYSVDEYMYFLKGNLTMVLPSGEEINIKPGDAFIIPKGLKCQWKQTGYVHKIFMILDGAVPEADNLSLRRITLPDLTEPTCNGVSISRTDFLNAAGNMRVAVKAFGAVSQTQRLCTRHELITVLEGALQLHDGETLHDFGKGDTVYLHQGDLVGWKTIEGTRLIVASYQSAS